MDLSTFLGTEKVVRPRPSIDFVAGVVIPGRNVDTIDTTKCEQTGMPLLDVHKVSPRRSRESSVRRKPFSLMSTGRRMRGASAADVSETESVVVEDGGLGGGGMEVNICLVNVQGRNDLKIHALIRSLHKMLENCTRGFWIRLYHLGDAVGPFHSGELDPDATTVFDGLFKERDLPGIQTHLGKDGAFQQLVDNELV